MWDPPLLRRDTRRHQNESALEGAVIVTAITLSPGRLRVVWVTSCVTPSPFWGIFSWADFSLSLAAVKSQTGQCWREISHRNLYVLSDGIIMVCLFSIIVSVSCSLAKLFVTLWTIACQAPLSMGLPSQEYWSRLPFPPPVRIFLTQALNPGLLHCRQILYHLSHQGSQEMQVSAFGYRPGHTGCG